MHPATAGGTSAAPPRRVSPDGDVPAARVPVGHLGVTDMTDKSDKERRTIGAAIGGADGGAIGAAIGGRVGGSNGAAVSSLLGHWVERTLRRWSARRHPAEFVPR